MIQYFPIVTGSLTVLGNINVSGSITTSGSITISGSITSASFATSASNATNAISASYANNLTVAGTLTAQTLVVQTITSSVDFVTGSTRFGSLSSNTHIITGSMYVTGAFYVTTGSVGIGTINPVGNLDVRVSAFTPTSSGSALLVEEKASNSMGQEFYIWRAGTYLSGRPSGGIGSCNSAALRIAGGGVINGNYTGGGTTNFVPSIGIASVLSIGDGDGFIFYTTGSLTVGTSMNMANYEVMRITSAGNVGIGVTSPISTLSIGVTSNTSNLGSTGLTIGGASMLTSGNVMMLNFTPIGASSNRTRAGIGCLVGSDWGTGNLTFYTRTATDASAMTTADERMRISGGGNVLIGTTTDNGLFKLQVSGDASASNVYFPTGDSYASIVHGSTSFQNQSSVTINLTSEFPNSYFNDRSISLFLQIVSASSGTNSMSYLWHLLRTGAGTWSGTSVSGLTNGNTITSVTATGTTFTVNFSAGAQYGSIRMSIATYA